MPIRILVLIFFLFFQLQTALTQNRPNVRELMLKYENTSLSDIERFNLVRALAHNHPDVQEAMSYAREALNLAQKLENPDFIAKAYEELGLNERLLGNSKESVEWSLKALRIFEDVGDSVSRAATLVQIGSNLLADGEALTAIDYFRKAEDVYSKNDQNLNRGLTLINLGEAYRVAEYLDSAIFNFDLALSLNNAIRNEIIEGYARGNLGMALRSKGELEQAKSELIRANEILTELGDPYSVSVYTADLAQISLAEGKQEQAEQQLLEAYTMAKREGLKEQIRDFSEMLVSFYEARNEFSKALDYQKVYQVYQDSLVNKENVQEIERLKANYQIEKREDQIGLLQQLTDSQQTFNLALGGGILIFGILAAMLYQSNKQKREANAMLGKQQVIVVKREEEKAVLLKELNHRVKNNLQMVSSLLSLQGNQLGDHPAAEAINAGKMRVEALSMIHQKLYQDDVHTSILIKEHLQLLVSNLLYSYGDPFKPSIVVEPSAMEMDIDTAIPLSLIVNELVTNAMKYAFEGIQHPELKISLVQPNGYYHLEISDNGVGIDQEKDTSNSFGLRLVRSLVDQLHGNLEIDNNPAGGTSFIIKLRAHQNTES